MGIVLRNSSEKNSVITGCPLIRVSLEDRFYCIEGVLSSECPLKTGFTV